MCTFILTINIILFATPTLRHSSKLNLNTYNFADKASIAINLVANESEEHGKSNVKLCVFSSNSHKFERLASIFLVGNYMVNRR